MKIKPSIKNKKNNNQHRKIIVFELNEVPYKVWDYFVSLNNNSNAAKLLHLSDQFTVRTPDSIYLHPKTSWQTFHRGVPDVMHGILEFNEIPDGVDDKFPQIWNILRQNGVSVGIGASIGSYPLPATLENILFYLPDPFAQDCETFPKSLEPFQRFNLGAVQESGRVVRRKINKNEALHFLLNIPRLQISPRTLLDVTTQITDEFLHKHRIVRRRTLQALLTFDVVLAQIQRTHPDFCTIFSNHVASSMHRYWAAAFPEDYIHDQATKQNSDLEHETTENHMPPEWIRTYRGEIAFSMSRADRMIHALMKFVNLHPEYCLLVITTMGQKAARAIPAYNQAVITNFTTFMSTLGFSAQDWERLPGMEPTYGVSFCRPSQLNEFQGQLRRLTIAGHKVNIKRIASSDTRIFFALNATDIEPTSFSITVNNSLHDPHLFGLSLEPIQDMAPSTGWHTPLGSALFYDPKRSSSTQPHRSIVTSTAFTAAIIDFFGAPRPNYMPDPSNELAVSFAL